MIGVINQTKNFIMSKLMNLKGVKLLSKTEQQAINGGVACNSENPCPGWTICDWRWGNSGICQNPGPVLP